MFQMQAMPMTREMSVAGRPAVTAAASAALVHRRQAPVSLPLRRKTPDTGPCKVHNWVAEAACWLHAHVLH
jgi:hypothetical protein